MTTFAQRFCSRWGSYLGAVVLLALLMVTVLVFMASMTGRPTAFTSDDLYPVAVIEDLLAGRDMAGWHLTCIPLFFPDLVLLLPCQAIFSNVALVFTAYSLLFFGSCVGVLTCLGRQLGVGWLRAFQAACAGMLLLFAAHLHPAYASVAQLMYQPGFHLGAVLSGLLLTAGALHGVQHGVGLRLGLFLGLLGPLAVFSDRLLVVELVAPLLAGLGLLALLRAAPLGRLSLLAGLLASGWLLAGGLRAGCRHMGLVLAWVDFGPIWPDWESVGRFGRAFHACMPGQTLRQALLLGYLLLGLVVLACWLRRKRAEVADAAEISGPALRPAVLLGVTALTLAPLSNLAALFVVGCHYTPPMDRYLPACWLIPFFAVGLLLQLVPGRLPRLAEVLFPAGVVLFALYRLAGHGLPLEQARLEPPYPPLAQALDRLVRERGPMRGLAGFWVARRMDFLTHERVRVCPVYADCTPYLHAANPNRYLDDDPTDLAVPVYRFLIVSPDPESPSAEHVLAEFGAPAEKIAVGFDQIWLYERMHGPRFEAFLQGQLAQRLCRRKVPIGPVSPAVLAQAKPNLFRWSSARNVQPPPGQDLEIRFGRPVSGSLLDVGARATDQYRLTFYRAKQQLATLDVPAVAWTGAHCCYATDPGIQSRLLRLPEALRAQTWDRVLVRPTGPFTPASLGHFLLFASDVTVGQIPSASASSAISGTSIH